MKKAMLFWYVALTASILCTSCQPAVGGKSDEVEKQKIEQVKEQLKKKIPPTVKSGEKLTLLTSIDGFTVTWKADKEQVIAFNGMVRLPDGSKEETVTLTAKIAKGSVTDSLTISVKVIERAAYEAIENAIRALENIPKTVSSDGPLGIPEKIGEGANAVSVKIVSSSHPAIIKTDGTVTRPTGTGETKVAVALSLRLGDSEQKYTLNFTVKHQAAAQNDGDFVASAKKSLDIALKRVDKDGVRLSLPSTVGTGTEAVNVTWESDKPDIINAKSGTVTRPVGAGAVIVTLTAALSKGSANDRKTFAIAVSCRDGGTWKAFRTDAFTGAVVLKETDDTLTADVSAPPAADWDCGISCTHQFEKSSLYMISFEVKAFEPTKTAFSVYNAADKKDIAYAPVTAATDWKEMRYLVHVGEQNKSKDLRINLTLKHGVTSIRRLKILDCWNNWQEWKKTPYSAWGLWTAERFYTKNAVFTGYDFTEDSIKLQNKIMGNNDVGDWAYSFHYKKAFNAGTYCFQFKNTGFEGFVQVDAIKVNGKPVAFAVPAMDAGAVCWFPFEISKDLANKEIEFSFWRSKRKGPLDDFITIEHVKTLPGVSKAGKKLSPHTQK